MVEIISTKGAWKGIKLVTKELANTLIKKGAAYFASEPIEELLKSVKKQKVK